MAELWHWLVQSDSGQYARIAMVVGIFACLAAVDLKRHGHAARRWKEYLFLVSCVVLALAYGIVNDQVTVGISWEYFSLDRYDGIKKSRVNFQAGLFYS